VFQVGSLQHPFIVPHIESWVDRGHTINTIYHYCSAGDLGTLLQKTQRQGKKFSEEQLKTWLCQV
jgi:serine/threonine protein kinase